VEQWSHVPARGNKRWNCRADALAKKHAEDKISSKRAQACNSRVPTIDKDRLFAILNNSDPHPEIDAQNVDLPELDPFRVPDDEYLLDYYAEVPLILAKKHAEDKKIQVNEHKHATQEF
jgi:hypothetical protein